MRVYGLAPGALPVWQGEIGAPGPLSLVTPWQRGVAILGESGGLISTSLEVRDLARAEHIKGDAVPPMLRLLWETRVADRTSLPSVWQQPHLLRFEERSVLVLERRSSTVRFRGDKVAAFLKKHGIVH